MRRIYKSIGITLKMAGFVTAFANPLNYVGGVSFNPDRDIPDLSGKVLLVTGGMLNSFL